MIYYSKINCCQAHCWMKKIKLASECKNLNLCLNWNISAWHDWTYLQNPEVTIIKVGFVSTMTSDHISCNVTSTQQSWDLKGRCFRLDRQKLVSYYIKHFACSDVEMLTGDRWRAQQAPSHCSGKWNLLLTLQNTLTCHKDVQCTWQITDPTQSPWY